MDDYRNLYWTRVISVDQVEDEYISRHPLAEDILSALLEIDNIDEDQVDSNRVIFDPQEFINGHPNLSKENFICDTSTLRELAVRTSSVR